MVEGELDGMNWGGAREVDCEGRENETLHGNDTIARDEGQLKSCNKSVIDDQTVLLPNQMLGYETYACKRNALDVECSMDCPAPREAGMRGGMSNARRE
jgi:hypothetical protein